MFYALVRAAFRAVAAPMFRFRCEGAEHVPLDGPAILVAPHRSWLDPACLGCASRRPVRFLIRRNVYDKQWARWFYRRMRAIPVLPGEGSASLSGMREALRVLSRGGLIGVFPEGRVVAAGARARVHPGAALLAARSGAPVIRVEIHGSAAAWPHGRWWPGPARVQVRFLPPLAAPSGPQGDAGEALQRRIEAWLREVDGEPAGES